MKPGRELDALVAEKVMGCRVTWLVYKGTGEKYPHCGCTDYNGGPHSNDPGGVWDNELAYYSTDISAAWEVVEKFDYWRLETNADDEDGGTHHFDIWADNGLFCTADIRDECGIKTVSAPHAICLVALKAKGAE